MIGLPKKRGGPAKTALQRNELGIQAYRLRRFLQGVMPRQAAARRCVSCCSRVTNRNLGGHEGRSALTGDLWCERCADFPQQLVLNFRRAVE